MSERASERVDVCVCVCVCVCVRVSFIYCYCGMLRPYTVYSRFACLLLSVERLLKVIKKASIPVVSDFLMTRQEI